MTSVRHAGALVVALTLAACGSGQTDKGASPPPSPSPSSIAAMTPVNQPTDGKRVSFRDYLSSIGVTGAPSKFDDTPGLKVTVPIPDGWSRTSDPLFDTGIEFVQPLGGTSTYPTVTLMAIGLNGDFDPKDAIRHANADALPPTATAVTESFDDYQGFPSAAAQGVAGGTEHYSRIVIASVPSNAKRYLVQLTVTTLANQPIADSPPLKSIVSGFTVTVS
jgi:Probable lipoprotein LpqN